MTSNAMNGTPSSGAPSGKSIGELLSEAALRPIPAKLSRREQSYAETVDQFRDAMRAAGVSTAAKITADGKLERFHVEGDKPGTKNGWYVLHADGLPAGEFGRWNRDFKQSWCAKDVRKLTATERKNFEAQRRERETARRLAEEELRAEARMRAAATWDRAAPADDDHPYLVKKGVQSHGLRIVDGKLVVPVRDQSGELHGLQFIAADGGKRFLTGTAKAGHFHLLGEPAELAGAPLLIAEGYATGATLHETTGYAVAVAFDAGNLRSVALSLRAKFPAAQIVLAADNDHRTEGNPGLANASEAAQAVGGVVIKPEFSPDDPGTDWNDYAAAHGIEAAGDAITLAMERMTGTVACSSTDQPAPTDAGAATTGSPTDAPARRIINFTRIDQIQILPVDWLITGWLVADTLACIVGPSGIGKTFIAIDWACCVATGRPWCDQPTVQGAVFYLAGEGMSGIRKRTKAWELATGSCMDGAPFYVADGLPFLVDDENADEVVAAIEEIVNCLLAESGHQPRLIVIDTVARAMSGAEENSAKDMGGFVQSLDKLRKRWGATVLVLHHTGLSPDTKTRGRGSSALRGALDSEFLIKPLKSDQDQDAAMAFSPTGAIELSATKCKDWDSPDSIRLSPKMIEIEITGVQGEAATATSLLYVPYGMAINAGEVERHEVRARSNELKQQGMTSRKVAELLFISKSTVDRWWQESRKPPSSDDVDDA